MIDSKHDVQLNGVNYRVAEDAQGEHYSLSGEPLRPPNAVMVQGEGKQDQFQARPDMLLWNITDWSGGEGQIVYDSQAANRHAVLYNVDPFIRPGTLQPGYDFQQTTDSGASPLLIWLALTKMNDKLIGMSIDTAAKYYIWDSVNEYWGSVQTITTAVPTAVPAPGTVCADDTYVYFQEISTANIYRLLTGTTVGEVLSSSVVPAVSTSGMIEHGDYLYFCDFAGSEVVEIPKSGATPVTPVQIWTGDTYKDSIYTGKMAAGANRVYVMLTAKNNTTSIVEIVPTSAAGPGYGREIARFAGLRGTSLWWHSGTLFIGGLDGQQATTKRILLYLIPGGDYGSLGRVRPPEEESYSGDIVGGAQGDLLLAPFITEGDTGASRLWVIDTVGGGYAQIAEIDGTLISYSPIYHNGEWFFSNPRSGAGGYTYRVYKDQYVQADSSYAITPWHNMGLSDEKILSSLVLSCEALPADWDIILSYAVNGSSSYTTAGTYTTDSGTGTKYTISTDSATKKFRSLRVKIAFDYTGAGSPTTKPVVHGVEVRAQVAQPVRVWNLMLDLSDDHSGGSQSHVGSLKASNVVTAGQSGNVVDFKDGYLNRLPGSYTAHDVIVDGYRLTMSHPGEGVAMVSLREVV